MNYTNLRGYRGLSCRGDTRGWPIDHADRMIGSLHGITVQAVGGWLAAASESGQPALAAGCLDIS